MIIDNYDSTKLTSIWQLRIMVYDLQIKLIIFCFSVSIDLMLLIYLKSILHTLPEAAKSYSDRNLFFFSFRLSTYSRYACDSRIFGLRFILVKKITRIALVKLRRRSGLLTS